METLHFQCPPMQSLDIQPFSVQVLINPELRVVDATKVLHPESCESIKGMSALVARHRAVTVKGNRITTLFLCNLRTLLIISAIQCFRDEGFRCEVID